MERRLRADRDRMAFGSGGGPARWSLSAQAWLVLVTFALLLGTAVAAWNAQRRLVGTQAALAPMLQALNAGTAPRLCGNVDVRIKPQVPHGDAMALLRRLDTVLVDGPDAGGAVRLRIFARDPVQALAALQRSPLMGAVTPLPYCQ